MITEFPDFDTACRLYLAGDNKMLALYMEAKDGLEMCITLGITLKD